MKKDLTELVFILDRSGSMGPLVSDTIGGFNSVLKRNQDAPGDAVVTTVLFDNEIRLLHDRLPIQAVQPITEKDYRPGGMTALLDAMGMAIDKIDQAHRHMAEDYRPEHVQFVIITDGLENASREYSRQRIRQLVLDKQAAGWDFLFLGANMDAIAAAESMGIERDRAVTTMADSAGVSLQYEAVARATMAMRHNAPRGAAWKADVEADTNKRKHH